MNKQKTLGSVLLVDDDAATRLSLQALLEEEFTIGTASNVQEALDFLGKNPVDVVVTDYDMPGGSGVDLLHKLKDCSPLSIGILLTGQPHHPAVSKAQHEQFAFGVLSKTSTLTAIMDCIKNALQAVHARQTLKPA